jgi:2-polyprenyl-3-methyl-5-hydroxy-6-metoxy-1,4-benzoquinol methylase
MKTALLELRRAAKVAAITAAEAFAPSPLTESLPPPRLRDKVLKGRVSAGQFDRDGADVATQIRAVLVENGSPLAAGQRVYEWGCGCGRVTRHLIPLGLDVHGSDVDAELIDWCRAHIDRDLAPGPAVRGRRRDS